MNDHAPKKLSKKQQLAWDRRCLNAMIGNLLRMRQRFTPEELTNTLCLINRGIEKIDVELRNFSKVAKRWSKQK